MHFDSGVRTERFRMNPFRLTEKDVVIIDGVRFAPAALLVNGIALRPEGGGASKPHQWDELTKLWLEERLRIEPEFGKGLPRKLVEDMRRDISSFGEDQQKIALRRRRYVRALEFGLSLRNMRRTAQYRPAHTKKPSRIVLKAQSLDLVCERVAKVIEPNGVADAPSGAALLQWYRRYQRSGRCLSALVPQRHHQGNRKPRLWTPAYEIMNRFAVAQYLQPERPRATDIFCMVRDEIRRVARQAGMDAAQIESVIPDIQSFYRTISKIESREKTYYRDARTKADRTHRIKGRGPRYQRPGEAVQIDSTKLPIVVRDPATGLRFKQVTLTIVIDLATRAIIGFYIGLEEGYPTIQEALRMAMLPKTWLANLPGIDHPVMGTCRPGKAITDQGADYRSNDLVMACGQLGIRLLHAPAGRPDLKGIVERQFREVKEVLFSGMPGSLFKNGERRPEYDAAGNAKLNLEQTAWAVCKYICDIYMQKWHEGIDDTPAEKWRKLVELYHVDMAPSVDQLIPLISSTKVATIQHTGIEWMGLFYGHGSEELQALIDRHGPGRIKYQFKIDTMDVGRGYLLGPDGRWITLLASDPDARGRTRHDHLVVRAEARSRKKATERVTQADMDAAKRVLRASQEAVNDRRQTKRVSSRTARFLAAKVDPLAKIKDDFQAFLGLDDAGDVFEDGVLTADYELVPARPQLPAPAAPALQDAGVLPDEIVETQVFDVDPLSTTDVTPPVSDVPEAADTEMPSVVVEDAADVMPRRNRSAALVDFA
ncbi:DDE-type integrase/transposase/recombinase [Methylorubrum rhodesianum]|uniref:DDE-type integrase/transposase/recombinase n=2 Tax=Methylorubrum TaxID=2282523 RepID=UPI001AEF2D7B|nr:DDE-type integrase/transposase/recombinase [Methylorubrum rhodesianum]